MKPRIDSLVASPVFAQTMATCAVEPFVIHILAPLSTQLRPGAPCAVVIMPAGLDPKSGSVSPKQPMISPAAIAGR